ncbi:MAG: response regulator [Gemmataceae bacterium]
MGSQESVWVVDSDQEVTKSISQTLHKHGYACVIASDTTALFREGQQTTHGVVLVDAFVGGMSPMTFLRKFREQNPLSVPIIMTNSPSVQMAVESFRCGAFDYFSKPLSTEALLATIREAMACFQRRKRQQSQASHHLEWETIFDSFPDLLIVLECSHEIVACNSAAASTFGLDKSELLGKRLMDLAPGLSPPVRMASPPSSDPVPQTWQTSTFGRLFQVTSYPLSTNSGSRHRFLLVAQALKEDQKTDLSTPESTAFLEATLDSLTAHIAVLDSDGTILKVNKAWRDFGERNQLSMANAGVGSNYLSVCERASGPCSQEAQEVVLGLRSVLSGKKDHFYLAYPCHGPSEKRWFQIRVEKFPISGPVRVVVAHETITEPKQLEEAYRLLLARTLEVQEQEQRRISRELHDGLGQRLTYLSLLLSDVLNNWDTEPPPGLVELREQVGLAVDETRALVRGLRPLSLDEFGLVPALEKLTSDFTEASGVPVELNIKGFDPPTQERQNPPNNQESCSVVLQGSASSFRTHRLPSELETVLYRVIQESLNNVAKHADATRVKVNLLRDERKVTTSIEDDGIGFDVSNSLQTSERAQCFGLLGIRERVELQGGTMSIQSVPNGGTTLAVVLHLLEVHNGPDQDLNRR